MRAPEQALARSSALLKEAPEFVEARVLYARASLRVGDTATAFQELSALLAPPARAASDPAVVLDGGRAALAQKDLSAAARFYRSLGGGAALLPDLRQQVVAYIEIAGALLAEGSAPLDDVLAYLREARRRAPGTGFGGLCAALTAVAWSASGHDAEAQAALAEVSDATALQRLRLQRDVWLADGMLDGLLGFVLERSDPEASKQHYQALAGSLLGQRPFGKLASRASTTAARSRARGRTP
jgi:hypothetical protein